MLEINDKNQINARDIYTYVGVKTQFHKWIKRCIDYADLHQDKDFWSELTESTGGRPLTVYYFTIEAAKEMCIVSATSKAKELRRWLIDISIQRENLDLITIEEAAFAVKVINCLKYIDNQKEALSMHQKHFVDKNIDILNKKYLYSEFAIYRAKIVGWDKESVDKAIDNYLKYQLGYNHHRLDKETMPVKLSFLDINEAIRVSVMDILYSKETDAKLANKFSLLCKKMAKAMKVTAERENTSNIFQQKQNIETVKSLSIEQEDRNKTKL